MIYMRASYQEKPMRHVMVFARAFRTPLQKQYAASEAELPDDFCALLEMADERLSSQTPSTDD